MLRLIGIVVMIAGILAVAAGVIMGQSGTYVPSNILGLFNPVVAVAFYGGAVAAFVGFAIAVVNGKRPA